MATKLPPQASTSAHVEAHPESALDAAIKAARLASPVIEGPHGARHILVPEGFRLEAAHDPHALPPHIIKTAVVVDQRASLSAYVNRFSDARSVLIADYDAGSIKAVLDWHFDNAVVDGESLDPQPREHTCTLKLRPSEEFKRWAEMENSFHGQAEFAAFLEENAVDVIDPEPAVLIEISRDLEGTQGVTFKSSTRLENGDRSFVYETETRAKGDIKVPREFVLSIPLYEGEEPVPLRCAFRWRINGGQLQMGFIWRRVEYQRRAHFMQIAVAAAEETGRPVFFGRAS
ncbi:MULTISPECIES: DUF2303 family protein [Pseudomonadota]|uniref:DUF2303 family protein n=1 Tax=Pseudomonadota TaxID=1224 RepID=UPI002AFF9AB1|nr:MULTISPECIES: DUF2303 family protein [Pseudomonadota]